MARMAKAPEGAAAVFWSRVHKTRRCWWWLGGKPGGYGAFSFEGQHHAAHRFSYELNVGPIPAGLMVLHRCDNPSCVRPAHLFVGTNADNIRDASAKGRLRTPIVVVDDFGVEGHLPATKRQTVVLAFIQKCIARTGLMPTLQEIADGVGLSSLATVHKHLESLHRRGLLRREYNRTRGSVLTGACPACGQTLPQLDDQQKEHAA